MPAAPAAPRAVSGRARPVETKSRLERIRAEGRDLPLPPLADEIAYMVGLLLDVGPCGYGAAGPVPLSSAEIESWLRLSGYALQPWEVRTLRAMSGAYCQQSRVSDAADCPPPWSAVVEVDREAVSKKVGDMFRTLARAKR